MLENDFQVCGSTFHQGYFIFCLRVSATFAACQIDERDLSEVLRGVLLLQDDLEDGVRSRRVLVGGCRARRSHAHATTYQRHHIVDGLNVFFTFANHLNRILVIFQDAQSLSLVEQIEHFGAVDFEECAANIELTLVRRPMNLPEYVVRRQCVDAAREIQIVLTEIGAHGEGFTFGRETVDRW